MESIQEAGEEAETPSVDSVCEEFFCQGMQKNREILEVEYFLRQAILIPCFYAVRNELL